MSRSGTAMLVSALFGHFMMPRSEEYGPYLRATSARFVTQGEGVRESESRGIVHVFESLLPRTLHVCPICRQTRSSQGLNCFAGITR